MHDSYELLPFESRPARERHLSAMEVMARLHGMRPQAVGDCRVLELGGSTASNLIPQALMFPESRFVMLDSSESEVQTAREVVRRLGIENIELVAADICSWQPETAAYDYIICHGLFSWVPEDVRERIFEVCKTALAPQGVAYVSYNALPGWARRNAIRERLLAEDDPAAETEARVAAARDVLQNMLAALPSADVEEAKRQTAELKNCLGHSDSFIMHELLAEHCEGYLFEDFCKKAAEFELQYLAEAKPTRMRAWHYEDVVLAQGEKKIDFAKVGRVARESYLDSVYPQSFRGTLLCRKDAEISQQLLHQCVSQLNVSSAVVPLHGDVDLSPGALAVFMSPGKQTVEVTEAELKAALVELSDIWPESLYWEELCERVGEKLGNKGLESLERREVFLELSVEFFLNGFFEFHATPLLCTKEVLEKPLISPYARLQAESGAWATTLRHEFALLRGFEQQVVPFIDGTRDMAELCKEVECMFDDGRLALNPDSEAAADESRRRQVVEESLVELLEWLAEQGFLVSESCQEIYT